MFENGKSLPFAQNRCHCMWGAYFCMGAYKHDVVVVIKMGAYISWGAYYPDYTVFGPCLTLVTF